MLPTNPSLMIRSTRFLTVAVAALCFLSPSPALAQEGLFFDGEVITYDVKKLAFTVGQATLEYRGLQDINGRKLYLIVFTATAPKFYDEEQIFMDPQSMYPVMVKRDLNIWGSLEKITEEYWHDQGLVKITKTADGKTEEIVIQKSEQIDNIYCFIARLRLRQRIDTGRVYQMHLPTKDVAIQYGKTVQLKAGGQTYESYHLASDPPQYEVWFAADQGLTPLRIDGGVGLVSSSLVMNKIERK